MKLRSSNNTAVTDAGTVPNHSASATHLPPAFSSATNAAGYTLLDTASESAHMTDGATA